MGSKQRFPENPGVPEFFQEESADALRAQVAWTFETLGLDAHFFSSLLDTREDVIQGWLAGDYELSPEAAITLREFWSLMLHILSLWSFDTARVREVFTAQTPEPHNELEARLLPPWRGTSLRSYFEATGENAIAPIDHWITGLRFGDFYSPSFKS